MKDILKYAVIVLLFLAVCFISNYVVVKVFLIPFPISFLMNTVIDLFYLWLILKLKEI